MGTQVLPRRFSGGAPGDPWAPPWAVLDLEPPQTPPDSHPDPPLGPSWRRLEAVLGPSWVVSAPSWNHLGVVRRPKKPSRRLKRLPKLPWRPQESPRRLQEATRGLFNTFSLSLEHVKRPSGTTKIGVSSLQAILRESCFRIPFWCQIVSTSPLKTHQNRVSEVSWGAWELSWGRLGASCAVLARLWGVWERLKGLLRASWPALGAAREAPGGR